MKSLREIMDGSGFFTSAASDYGKPSLTNSWTLDGGDCVDDLCDAPHVALSCSILVLALSALFENLVLVFALNSWELKKTIKMFWFIWQLCIADTILSATFIYYHLRRLVSCPILFKCHPTYIHESRWVLVAFFGSISSSHFFVAAATIDRFIAIKWSLQYSVIVSTKNVRVVAATVWGFFFLLPLIGAISSFSANQDTVLFIAVIMMSCSCMVSALAVIVLNLWMVWFAWKCLKKISRVNVSVQESESNRTGEDHNAIRQRFKLSITLLLFVVSFLLSSVPWSVTLVFCNNTSQCTIKREEDYTLVLVLLHAVALPFLYGFRVTSIKNCVKDFSIKCYSSVTRRFSTISQ